MATGHRHSRCAFTLPVFSFAYVALAAGTGALLLFGAVQATMILWGFRKGERLDAIQVVGFVARDRAGRASVSRTIGAAIDGFHLDARRRRAWGVYSLRGKASKNPGQRYRRKFCACCSVLRGCSRMLFLPMDTC